MRVCVCRCMYVRKVRTYVYWGKLGSQLQGSRTDKHVGTEGTCLRVGSRWCAAQAACHQSPVTSLTVGSPTGPRAYLWEVVCVCVCVCVGVCGKQLLMPFYNSLFLFSVSVFSFVFSVLLPLHFTYNFAIILVSNVCNFIFHHSTRFCCCYMLHATTETSNCRVFSVCSPRLEFTVLEDMMLPAYLHYFIYHLHLSQCTIKK